MKKNILFIFSLLLLVIFFSCGSSSSANSEKKETKTEEEVKTTKVTVKGSVVDGEIEGAKVTLVEITTDDTGKALDGEVTTGEDGSFSIEVKVPDGKTIDDYMVKATGGVDTSSGDEQGEVELTRPIEGTTDQMVTPITSMLTEEVKEAIKSGGKAKEKLKAAKTAIKTLLGLDSDDDVTKNPLDNDKVLRNAVLLNKIAKKVKKEDRKKAFAQLRTVLKKDIVKATFTGKSFADGAAEDTGNGVLNKLFADAELTVPEADKSTAKSTFIEEAKADKENASLKNVLPGSDEKAKHKKLALLRELNKKVLMAFIKRDKAVYDKFAGANADVKQSYHKGVIRLVTYCAAAVSKLEPKVTAKFIDVAGSGILKDFNVADIASLGYLDLSKADTVQKKITALTGMKTADISKASNPTAIATAIAMVRLGLTGNSGVTANKIKAILKKIRDDEDFKKESAFSSVTGDKAFETISGYIQ